MRKDLYLDLVEKEETHFWHKAKRQFVSDLIVRYHRKEKSSTTILDVGIGSGGNTKALQQFGEVWGIDASDQAIHIAKTRGLKNIRRESAEHTSFKNNYFDVITILDLLEHARDRQVLQETYRISKKGGLVIITVPAYPWLWSTWDEILGHKRRYTKNSLETVLSNQHFQILKLSYCYSFLLLPAMIVRVIKSFLYKDTQYPSDFSVGNKLLHAFCGTLAAWERFIIIKLNIPLPFGLSLVAVCRKSS